MEAYSHLTEWKSLQYCSTVYIDENSPPNLDKMWSEPLYQVIEVTVHSLVSFNREAWHPAGFKF